MSLFNKTREEARQALIEGKKVRHMHFTSNEHLEMQGHMIMTEDGFYFGDMFDSQEWMKTGWCILDA